MYHIYQAKVTIAVKNTEIPEFKLKPAFFTGIVVSTGKDEVSKENIEEKVSEFILPDFQREMPLGAEAEIKEITLSKLPTDFVLNLDL